MSIGPTQPPFSGGIYSFSSSEQQLNTGTFYLAFAGTPQTGAAVLRVPITSRGVLRNLRYQSGGSASVGTFNFTVLVNGSSTGGLTTGNVTTDTGGNNTVQVPVVPGDSIQMQLVVSANSNRNHFASVELAPG